MTKNPMFSFVQVINPRTGKKESGTRNPLGGRCPHECSYCYGQSEKDFSIVTKYGLKKYYGECRLYPSVLKERFRKGDFVFLSMRDPNSYDVTDEMKHKLYDWYRASPEARFLELSKNPKRFVELLVKDPDFDFPSNMWIGATIESNKPYPQLSKAPLQPDRMFWMKELRKMKDEGRIQEAELFLCAEPVLEFDLKEFESFIHTVNPVKFAIGYDNYWKHNKLLESSLDTVIRLIEMVEEYTEVEIKTLREAWWDL